jgi:ribonuclease HII
MENKYRNFRRITGIDENGFGPVMGPLIITGTTINIKKTPVRWLPGISDSKKFFPVRSIKNFKKIEETVIALFFLLKKYFPESPEEIICKLCIENTCPARDDFCHKNIPQTYIWADKEQAKKLAENFALWSEKENFEIENIESRPVCVKEFNAFTGRGDSKFFLNFTNFCKVVNNIRDKKNLEVQAGRIGSMLYYSKFLRYSFPAGEIEILQETPAKAIYGIHEKNKSFTFAFFTDVETISFPAAVSSIVGKYIREIFMESIRKSLNIKEEISGYRDVKTKAVIKHLVFKDIPENCILRIK